MLNMQTVADARRANLEALVVECGTLDQVAASIGSSPIYLSQIRNRTPDAKTGRPRDMGSQLARRLELAFKKPVGWMDQQHWIAGEQPARYGQAQDLSHPNSETQFVETNRVLVIGTIEMGASNEFELRAGPDGAAIGTIPALSSIPGSFAIRVMGDLLYPAVRHGACIVVDPAGSCEAGELVLVEMTEGHFIVAELVAMRADTVTIAPVQGGQRRTLPAADVAKVQAIAGVVSASQFQPKG